ncbi:hypothetical protein RKD52_000897 [Metabacillus sp. SLBN-84]
MTYFGRFAYPLMPFFAFSGVRFFPLLTLSMPFFALAGYDSSLCLPCPCRFSLLLGTILPFAYPDHAVFRSCWVRFFPLLTLSMLFCALAGYDSSFCLPCPAQAYPPKSIFGFTGPAFISPYFPAKKAARLNYSGLPVTFISNAFQAQL